jgi:hypothetical protein
MIETADQAIASAVKFLIGGGEHEAAMLLVSCEGTVERDDYDQEYIKLTGPRAAYEALYYESKHVARKSVLRAFEALGRPYFIISAALVDIDPQWRMEMMELIRGRGVTNQGADVDKPIIWQNLKFRSVSERRIAEALDRANVLYLPNCRARLNFGQSRANREADFLVCHQGKWGILEVDGAPYHPPTRTVHDHERDRLFKGHGIRVVEHFDSGACAETPDAIVKRFLDILAHS